MFNGFFSKKDSDLDGKAFREKFENTDQAVLLDVRTPAEFNSGSIPGAQNIDFMSPDFQNRIQTLDKDKTYFLYCRSGNRSGSAASIMEKAGFKSFNLVGGIGAWPK